MCQLLIKHMRQLASKLCSKSLQLCYFHFFLWWVQANAQCISQGGHEDRSQKAFPNKTFVVGWEKVSVESLFTEVSYFTVTSLTTDDRFCIWQLVTAQPLWGATQLNSLCHPKQQPGVAPGHHKEELICVFNTDHSSASTTDLNSLFFKLVKTSNPVDSRVL